MIGDEPERLAFWLDLEAGQAAVPRGVRETDELAPEPLPVGIGGEIEGSGYTACGPYGAGLRTGGVGRGADPG